MPSAIDFHIHLRDAEAIGAMGARVQQMAAYFGRAPEVVPIEQLADGYRERDMMAVIMNTTDETVSGNTPVANDHIADVVARFPDVFVGFGAIDPWMGAKARDEIRRCAQELGLKGIGELNPARQKFKPNDPRFYPLWQEASDNGLMITFHSGMMAMGAGTPGGGGFKLDACRPIPYLDDVAADFPELIVIGAHPSWPWPEENLAIARHKANFYIDLSGWAPKYFPDNLVRQLKTIVADKCLFGSDWPALTPERWLSEFDELGVPPTVREKILVGNAQRLLGMVTG